jgi:hypothetical protein
MILAHKVAWEIAAGGVSHRLGVHIHGLRKANKQRTTPCMCNSHFSYQAPAATTLQAPLRTVECLLRRMLISPTFFSTMKLGGLASSAHRPISVEQ